MSSALNVDNVYADAKKVSKPGVNYTVAYIEFKPGLEDMQQVKIALREQLYKKVNDELGRINAAYTEQHYTVSNIYFVEGEEIQVPRPAMMKTMALDAAASAPSVAVSNELTLTAVVEVASNRKKGE